MAADEGPSAALIGRPLPPEERGALARSLRRAGIETTGLDAAHRLFWRFETFDQVPVGFGGLDMIGRDAVLHSVVVLPLLRGRGLGRGIVRALEGEALLRKAGTAWVVAATAADFFAHMGYAATDPAILSEGAGPLPPDAIAMRKRLR